MSTPSMGAVPEPGRHLRPRLDGADPLLRIVTREVAIAPRQVVVRQGDISHAAHLLVSRLACRHRLLGDGRRQITALLVPGDMCDLDAVLLGRAHCFVESLSPCVLGEISAGELDDLDVPDPELRRALRRQLLRSEAISREWMVGMGRRSAKERLAHLLCELRERLGRVGLCDGDAYDFALTQAELADVLGLSTVHVNRTLQELRNQALIDLADRVLHVLDRPALAKVAGFDPSYIELA